MNVDASVSSKVSIKDVNILEILSDWLTLSVKIMTIYRSEIVVMVNISDEATFSSKSSQTA